MAGIVVIIHSVLAARSLQNLQPGDSVSVVTTRRTQEGRVHRPEAWRGAWPGAARERCLRVQRDRGLLRYLELAPGLWPEDFRLA
jgi:hypothetical protein